jgi:hypothetical protein
MKNLLLKFTERRCNGCPSFYEYSNYDDSGYGCVLFSEFECDVICKYAFMPRWFLLVILKIRDWKIDRLIEKEESQKGGYKWE